MRGEDVRGVSRWEGCLIQEGVWRYLGSVDVDFYCIGMGERSSTQSYNPHETIETMFAVRSPAFKSPVFATRYTYIDKKTYKLCFFISMHFKISMKSEFCWPMFYSLL